MIEIVRHTQRNVKRWSSGEMALRWTAAGMLETHIRGVVAIDEGLTALATAPRAWLRMSDVGSHDNGSSRAEFG
jgi:hypothetical protein